MSEEKRVLQINDPVVMTDPRSRFYGEVGVISALIGDQLCEVGLVSKEDITVRVLISAVALRGAEDRLHTGAEKKWVPSPGDQVRVIVGGPYEGCEAKVLSVLVRINLGPDVSPVFDINDLSPLLEQQCLDEEPEIKRGPKPPGEGDAVWVVDPLHPCYGQQGNLYYGNDQEWHLEFGYPPVELSQVSATKPEIEPDDPWEPKVGDVVWVLSSRRKYFGRRGIVKHIGDKGTISVAHEECHTLKIYTEDELSPVPLYEESEFIKDQMRDDLPECPAPEKWDTNHLGKLLKDEAYLLPLPLFAPRQCVELNGWEEEDRDAFIDGVKPSPDGWLYLVDGAWYLEHLLQAVATTSNES